jgi:drug/metabolite transporter (DMT)-like permease
MFKYVIILLIGICFEAAGVVYLSRGIKQINDPTTTEQGSVWQKIKSGATNPSMLLGVLFQATFFATLLYLLGKADVSFIWPLTSLGLVLTTFSAKFILDEDVSALRWSGVIFIVMGSMMILYSEKSKELRKPQITGTEQTARAAE